MRRHRDVLTTAPSVPAGRVVRLCLGWILMLPGAMVFAQAESPAPAPSVEPPPSVPSDGPPVKLDQIVVTAQRRAESINSVPIAITAFSGAALQALGVRDTRDFSNLVPGFTASYSGYNTPVYTLRGVGFNDATYTAGSTVGVYTDEVPLPYTIMTKGLNLDLNRVEILKGPQGTLYGRNTTGGAINYIANKPTPKFTSGASVSYGSFGTVDAEGFVSDGLTDTLRGRLALHGTYSRDGWQYSNTRPDDRLGRQNKLSGRIIADWKPDQDFLVRFMASGWHDGSEPQAPQAIALSAQNPITGNLILAPEVRNYPFIAQDTNDTRVADWCPCHTFRLHDSFYQAALTANWDISDDLALTSIASYGKVRSDGSFIPMSGLDSPNFDQKLDAQIKTINFETRLSGVAGADSIHWMGGVNAARDLGQELHTSYTNNASVLFPIAGTGISLLAGPEGNFFIYGNTGSASIAGFANSEWQFADAFKLTTGIRYTLESKDFSGCIKSTPDNLGTYALFNVLSLVRGGNGVPPGSCLTLDSQGNNDPYMGTLGEHNLSGRLVLDWMPAADSLFYASVSRGYKSGGFPVLSATYKTQYAPVTQERLDAFELGSKTDFLDRALHLNSAVFYYGYKDKQLLTYFKDPLFGPLPILKNAPKSHVEGIELELSATPLHGLLLSVSGSYIITRIDEFSSTNNHGDRQDFSGRPFNFAPRLQYTALADYAFAVWRDYKFAVGADYSFKGRTNSTLEGDPQFEHRPYGLIDLRMRLGRTDGAWSLLLWGRNITDQFSTVSVTRGAGDALTRYTGQPRTIGATLSCNF